MRAQVGPMLGVPVRGFAQSCCSLLSSSTKHERSLMYAVFDTLWLFRLLTDQNIKISMQHLLTLIRLFFTFIYFSCFPDIKCSNVFGRHCCTKRHLVTSWRQFLSSLYSAPFVPFSNSYRACKSIPAIIVYYHFLCFHNFMKCIHIRELPSERAPEGLAIPHHPR